MKTTKPIALAGILLAIVLLIQACESDFVENKYIQEIEQIRNEKNNSMKNDADSPFNRDSTAEFHELNYYPVDPGWRFSSKLYTYEEKEEVTIFGTKGEERTYTKYGYVSFEYEDSTYNVNVYLGTTRDSVEYLMIAFTDETTGEETYHVGRYLDIERHPDPDFEYAIDFNLAYNPYCAYSANYSCAMPREEDHIPVPIRAGEKKFHE
jgi:uncharacterized protein (DUF1684 family)